MLNQYAELKTAAQRLTLMAIAILFAIAIGILGIYSYQLSDPYVKEVLSLQGDTSKGEAIFQINCAGCHGAEATGFVGPSLEAVTRRKSKISLIEQVISGKTPPMPKFQASPQEMADLLSYLEKL